MKQTKMLIYTFTLSVWLTVRRHAEEWSEPRDLPLSVAESSEEMARRRVIEIANLKGLIVRKVVFVKTSDLKP